MGQKPMEAVSTGQNMETYMYTLSYEYNSKTTLNTDRFLQFSHATNAPNGETGTLAFYSCHTSNSTDVKSLKNS